MDIAINIISDTSGYATEQIVKQSLVQFDIDLKINIYPNIRDLDTLKITLNNLLVFGKNQIIYHSFQDEKMNIYTENFILVHDIEHVDIMSNSIKTIARKLGRNPISSFSKNSLYNTNFFRKFDALDFAIKYDDGKDFNALRFCDIAIIGISRTSKTPLSMYLASKGYRVLNIPILLESDIPSELFEIDYKKIIGLTIDKKVLSRYRKQRLKLLQLSEDSLYSDEEKIAEEIEYAEEIMKDIGCLIIDTTDKALEEIAEIILSYLANNERSKND